MDGENKVMNKEEYQNLTTEQIQNLPDEEFYALAKKHSELFPGLFTICDEDVIIGTFYRAYKRKFEKSDYH